MGTGQSGAALVETLARSVSRKPRDPVRYRIRYAVGMYRRRLRLHLGLLQPTEAQRMLLEIAARTYWLLGRVDHELEARASGESLDHATRALLHERTLMADRLTRTLTLLGRVRGPLASTPTTTAPPAPSPSSKAKRTGSGKAKDSRDPVAPPSAPTRGPQ